MEKRWRRWKEASFNSHVLASCLAPCVRLAYNPPPPPPLHEFLERRGKRMEDKTERLRDEDTVLIHVSRVSLVQKQRIILPKPPQRSTSETIPLWRLKPDPSVHTGSHPSLCTDQSLKNTTWSLKVPVMPSSHWTIGSEKEAKRDSLVVRRRSRLVFPSLRSFSSKPATNESSKRRAQLFPATPAQMLPRRSAEAPRPFLNGIWRAGQVSAAV